MDHGEGRVGCDRRLRGGVGFVDEDIGGGGTQCCPIGVAFEGYCQLRRRVGGHRSFVCRWGWKGV
eukprot:764363-Hanusia_phi.AAC.2